jgi:Lipocalin-like domain
MKNIFFRPWCYVLCSVIGVSAGLTAAQPPASAQPLAVVQDVNPVGVWKLISMSYVDLETGAVSTPWGANPAGQLTYSAKGRMSAVLTADPKLRTPASTGDNAAQERAALYLNQSAYAGTWSALGNTLTHKVETAVNPSWVGTDLVRYVTLDRDELTIVTAPTTRNDGKSRVKITLVWKRSE